jgi:hypothetical protein
MFNKDYVCREMALTFEPVKLLYGIFCPNNNFCGDGSVEYARDR